ncbi:MAG TPA: metalloregulator ArsR/SmtB family transcription factor [Bacteroidales bacterium]|nr:metalloregulator ArsR/SmtB family transcription factor [Bacteroidales bacterium]
MNKAGNFEESLQKIARVAKVLSHPARLAILKYLAESRTCISGDISDYIPLGRTTVSQHLKELKDAGLIKGEIEGLKINYCLNCNNIRTYVNMFDDFFKEICIEDFPC